MILKLNLKGQNMVKVKKFCKTCKKYYCEHVSFTKKLEKHELVSYSIAFCDSQCTLIFEKHFCGISTRSVEKHFFETINSIEEGLLRKPVVIRT